MLTINSKPKTQNAPDLFDTSYLTADLKGRSVRGGAITVFSQANNFILKTASTVVLARILTPAAGSWKLASQLQLTGTASA